MRKIFFIPLLFIVLMACNKKEVASPGFNVSINQDTVYKAGDPVNFMFSGNPNNITFYSGETGKQYEFRDRIEDGERTDVGVPLKNMTVRLDSYAYAYATPGTYTATFVATNTNVYGSETEVKEVQVTVNP